MKIPCHHPQQIFPTVPQRSHFPKCLPSVRLDSKLLHLPCCNSILRRIACTGGGRPGHIRRPTTLIHSRPPLPDPIPQGTELCTSSPTCMLLILHQEMEYHHTYHGLVDLEICCHLLWTRPWVCGQGRVHLFPSRSRHHDPAMWQH